MTGFRMPLFENILELVNYIITNTEIRIYNPTVDKPINYQISIDRKDLDLCFTIKKREDFLFQISYKVGSKECEIIDTYNYFKNDILDFIKKQNLDYIYSKIDDGTLYQISLKN